MKMKIFALMMAGILVFGLAGCGQKADEKTDDESADKTVDFSVALVTDTGGIDDKSFNQGTWEGIQKFATDTGAKIEFAQSNSDADYIPNLSAFAEDEYDLIVAPGFLFAKSMAEVSKNYAKQPFLIIDEIVSDRENVASAVFAGEEGSFLVGVAAAEKALEAGKDKVGFIGGGDFGLIHGFEAGYEAGVKAVDPNMTILSDYVGDFVDTGKAQSIANKMYDEGTYVIYHAAGSAGNGLIKEAKDRRANGEDVWAIGVDRDQYDDGIYNDKDSVILTSMMKRVDVAAYTVSELTMEGKFPGGQTLSFSLENEGIGIPKQNPNLSDEIVKKVDEFADKIKSGEIEVPTVPTRLQ